MSTVRSGEQSAFTEPETYAETRRPAPVARTLIPSAYTSEEFFAIERRRVFGASWSP